MVPAKPALRDEFSYQAIRRGRFFRLRIMSDDLVIVGSMTFSLICYFLGWAIGRVL